MKTSRIVVVVFCLILLSICTYAGLSSSTEVCTICGENAQTTEWYGTVIRRRQTPTALSTLLVAHGAVPPHPHHWLFAAGSGAPPFGPMCAIGPGRYLWWSCSSPDALTFMANIIRSTDPKTTDKIRRLLLTPKSSLGFNAALSTTGYYAADAQDPSKLKQWWSANRSDFLSTLDPSPPARR